MKVPHKDGSFRWNLELFQDLKMTFDDLSGPFSSSLTLNLEIIPKKDYF